MKTLRKILTVVCITASLIVALAFVACTDSSDKENTLKITSGPANVVLESNDTTDLTESLGLIVTEYTGTAELVKKIERVEKDGETLNVVDYKNVDMRESGEYLVTYSVSDGELTEKGSFTVTMPQKNIGNFDDGLAGWTGITNENLSNEQYGWCDDRDKYTDDEVYTRRYQTGTLFADTHKGMAESDKATFSSPSFKVFSDSFITFKLSGAGNGEKAYVALVDTDSGDVLEKYTNYRFGGRNFELTFLRYYYPVGEYAGKTVRLDFVDDAESGFGYIAFNDVWVNLSADEAQNKLNAEKTAMSAIGPEKETKNPIDAENYFSEIKAAYADVELIALSDIVRDYTLSTIGNKDLVLDRINLLEKVRGVKSYKQDVYVPEKRVVSVQKGDNVDTEGSFVAYDLSEDGEYVVTYEIAVGEVKIRRSFIVTVITKAPLTLRDGSFENGGLGWFVAGDIEGRLFTMADTSYFDWRPWFRNGNFFAWSGDKEDKTGYIYSEPFFVVDDTCISFQFGSTGKNPSNYVALVDAETDTELVRFTNKAFDGAAEMTMFHYVYDLSDFAGRNVYIKVNDSTKNNFGNFAVDDFRVNLTKEQAAEVIAEAKVLASAAMANLDRENADQLRHIEYVNAYYAALAVEKANVLSDADHPLAGKQTWDFENGYEGWYAVSDNMISSDKDFFSGDDWAQYSDGSAWTDCRKQGNKFFRTDDGWTGAVYSPVFTVSEGGHIAFRMGATRTSNDAYVAVCLANGGKELITLKNDAFRDPVTAFSMFDVILDLSKYAGQNVFIKLVDRQTNDFGFITFDNLVVNMTKAEAETLLAEVKAEAAAFQAAGTPKNQDRFNEYVEILKNYYASLDIIEAE